MKRKKEIKDIYGQICDLTGHDHKSHNNIGGSTITVGFN